MIDLWITHHQGETGTGPTKHHKTRTELKATDGGNTPAIRATQIGQTDEIMLKNLTGRQKNTGTTIIDRTTRIQITNTNLEMTQTQVMGKELRKSTDVNTVRLTVVIAVLTLVVVKINLIGLNMLITAMLTSAGKIVSIMIDDLRSCIGIRVHIIREIQMNIAEIRIPTTEDGREIEAERDILL